MSKKFTILLIIIIFTIPSFIMVHSRYIEPFAYWAIPSVMQSSDKGFMNIQAYPNPGYPMILYMISEISGLSPINILYIPIGTLLFGLSYLILSRKIFGDKKIYIVFLFIFYSIWDSTSMGNYNATFYALTHTAYIIFIFLILQTNNKSINICLVLLFMGSFTIHPEASIWMIMTIFCIYLFPFFQNILNKNKIFKFRGKSLIKEHMALSLTLIFVVIYLTWNRTLYNVWFRRFVQFDYWDSFNLLFSTKLASLKMTQDANLSVPMLDPVYYQVRIIQYIIIILPISIVIILMVWKVIINYHIDIELKKSSHLWYIFLLSATIDTIIYTIEGWVSIKYITLMFPFLTMLSLGRIKIKKLEIMKNIIIFIFIILVIVSGFIFSNELPKKWSTTYYDTETSATWLFQKFNNNTNILTDISTYGKYISTVEYNIIYFDKPLFYNGDNYNDIINSTYHYNTYMLSYYIVIDYKDINRPIQTKENRYFMPLSKYVSMIDDNIKINKIYDDSNIWILKRDFKEKLYNRPLGK